MNETRYPARPQRYLSLGVVFALLPTLVTPHAFALQPRGDGRSLASIPGLVTSAEAPEAAPGVATDEEAPAPARTRAMSSHPPETTPEIRAAIDRGLKFLVASQGRDGSWRSRGGMGGYPTAMTSLAGLALLASGSTPREGPYAREVSRALTFILQTARRDGLIAQPDEIGHSMHGHGFAMLFLAQCYGMEENPVRAGEIKLVLRRAIDLTVRSQSALGGWLYSPDSGGDEGSVTITQVQGLRAAKNAGISVPKSLIDRAMGYLDKSLNPDGGIRYQAGDSGPSRAPITAAAVACWYNAGMYDDPRAKRALAFSERNLWPTQRSPSGHYFYAHLYMAQIMYLTDEQKWLRYYAAIAGRMLDLQEENGAWEGDYVGQVYGTAVALIILQLPYKNLPIMQR